MPNILFDIHMKYLCKMFTYDLMFSFNLQQQEALFSQSATTSVTHETLFWLVVLMLVDKIIMKSIIFAYVWLNTTACMPCEHKSWGHMTVTLTVFDYNNLLKLETIQQELLCIRFNLSKYAYMIYFLNITRVKVLLSNYIHYLTDSSPYNKLC